jgi:hypothetical protein
MMKRLVGVPLALVLTATVSGVSCGGGGSGTCGMVTACGGDIVGNWRITSSCLKATGTFTTPECPSATVNASLQVTGTVSYTAALTYNLAFMLSGTETIGFPASCLTFSGVTVTCDQLNQSFAAMPPSPTLMLHCAPAGGGGCNCSTPLNATPSNETGTYVTSGGTLTTTAVGGAAESGGYCVKGTTLDLTPPLSMMQSGLIETGDLTLTLQ